MNTQRAFKVIADVAGRFDCRALIDKEHERLVAENLPEAKIHAVLGECLGLSTKEVIFGTDYLPSRIYDRYPAFALVSKWHFAELMAGPNGPAQMLKAIFGDKATTNAPSKKDEDKATIASVRARCDAKVLQINELFPNTYPVHLPVYRFHISTDRFISFEQVEELCAEYDRVVARFSELFLSDVQEDLPKEQALEFNLLATFLDAVDLIMPAQRVCHNYIQQYRHILQQEHYDDINDYVRIRRSIPVWRAREFYKNREFALGYVQKHPECKRLIRQFLQKVTAYECQYIFINNQEAHERFQNRPIDMNDWTAEDWADFEADDDDDWVYNPSKSVNPSAPYVISEDIIIPKDNTEITEVDRLIAGYGQTIVGSKRNGGADTRMSGNSWSIDRLKQRMNVRNSGIGTGHAISSEGKGADYDE